MRKAGRYTKIASYGKAKAEWHEGYVNSYLDYKQNVPVTYFVYKNSKTSLWYAVDIASGMAIAKAEKRKDLTRLDDETAERLYDIKKTEHYKELVKQFTMLVYEAEEALKRQA